MKKKIFILVLIVVAVSVYFLLGLKPKGTVSSDLSDRSKEFIADKASEQGSFWDNADIDGDTTPDTRGSIFNVDNCFSFTMLYRINNQRIEGECDGYYSFDNPKGTIVTYLRSSGSVHTVDQADGVSFRRLNKDIYEETQETLGGREYLIFNNLKEPYEATAFHYSNGYFLVFTLKAITTENLDKDLKKMLESIEIHKE